MVILNSKDFYLRNITLDDCNENYLNWMNDSEINKYLESRFTNHTIESLKDFVTSMNSTNNNILFAIIDRKTDNHIGNIKLGNIHPIHKYADIGLMIGDKNYWGHGIATNAINLVSNYAFDELHLRKVFAGVYENNIGSIKAFEKCGFKKAYVKKDTYFFDGKYIDAYVFELYNKNLVD